MASVPLNWLLKIGGATLKTTAKTLSEAVNTLHDTVTNLSTTVTNLGTSKADASTTTTALNNLETNKLNISDLLSLEEIEASTSLTGKGVTAESIKSLNNSLTANDGQNFKFSYDTDSGKYGYTVTDSEGADTFCPFSSNDNVDIYCGVRINAIDNAYGTVLVDAELKFYIYKRGKTITSNFPSSASDSMSVINWNSPGMTGKAIRVQLYGFRLISITDV